MLIKKLLRYYIDCLKYESYYAVQLKQEQLTKSLVDPLNIDNVYEQYEKMSKHLQEDCTIMFGYPLLKKKSGNNFYYLPLCLWNSSSFLSDRQFFKADHFGFHQEVYKSLADKHSLDTLNKLKEQFSADISTFLQDEKSINKLLDYTEFEKEDIVRNYVIVQAENSNSSNYHIIKEIKAILKDKCKPSVVLQSFLNHSYTITSSGSSRTPLHIVPGNSPQNAAINDMNYTISIVKGPPGTGKTQTILNLIANQVGRQENCVVASTNNQAVNNIVDKLDGHGINKHFFGYIRLGDISSNKKAAIHIRTLLERMTQEIKDEISNEDYLEYVSKSSALMEQITQAEKFEQQIIDMTNTINHLQTLIDILNDRLRLNHLTTMKNDFIALSIADDQIEFRLRELVDQPMQLYGINILRKFRSFIANKITSYMKARVKKHLRHIGATQIWDYIDMTAPFHSIAICEEVIKVINLENCLARHTEELALIKKRQLDLKSNLKSLYAAKNEIDLLIIRYQWLNKAKPILSNVCEMRKINIFVNELYEKGRVRANVATFPSFVTLFPVLLVSSLSARNFIPSAMSLDLAIIDESSQCSITSVFSLLQSTRRACFFGDTNQLSHIVSLEDTFSSKLFNNHLPGVALESYCFRNISAFERADQACQLNEGGKHLLSYHYRCIPSIASFSNQHFYHNRLRMMRLEPQRQLYKAGIYSTNVYGGALGTINQQELKEIESIVTKLENNGVTEIGIVTPFSAQKKKLIEKFRGRSNIKIGTVHTFQGGECQAIIFSTVISEGSTPFQIDFVQNNYRLINVALTRALDYFILVGNLAQIDNGHGYLTKLSHYIYTVEARSFHRPSIELSIAFNYIVRQENRKALMHEGERMIYNKLQIFLGGMPLLVFPKVPIKDVLSININLDYNLKYYYFTGHLDFVIYEKESLQPLCSIEYDGNYHRKNPKTIENDKKKDTLCNYAEFELIRIASNDEIEGWEKLKAYLKSFA